MVETIGNPLSWGARVLGGAGQRMGDVAEGMGSDVRVSPRVHSLNMSDIGEALRLGLADMGRSRSDVLVLVMVYPLIGLALTLIAFDSAMIPLVFPMAAGFALLGPLAAVGLYEMSRQHEDGNEVSWAVALLSLKSRVFGPIMVLGLYLMGLYVVWMVVALEIYGATMGPELPKTMVGLMSNVLSTPAGWALIWIGCGVGFIFAAVVLVTSMMSFPMLVDKPVGLPVAVATSMRVAMKNPAVVAVWGAIVAGLLVLGSVPFFIGLVLVLPILGHATWHLYRKAISYD
ncbi:DUF2189 domain-containing protein [Shimia abyssi]|uniref:Putative membrane protein n=1 Tax=Shimia abyssi TaxID=1662395 RepID=A0A2P8FHV2_9RHOB|nr:DUF2189 domain-containing protein [Shimia abyssi]PSL21250.1 putative membrane protein [Shimia abyssi]